MSALKTIYVYLGKDHQEIKNQIASLEEKIIPDLTSRKINIIPYFAEDIEAEQLISECQTYPVFSEYKIVKVFDFEKLNNKIFLNYLNSPSSNTILILVSQKLEKELPKELLEILKKIAHLYITKDKYDNDAQEYISNQLRNMEIKFTPDFIKYLVEQENTNISHLNTLCEMIKNYYTADYALTPDDIPNLMTSSKIPNIFEFIDTLFSKDLSKALRIFHRMQSEESNEFFILSMIYRQLKLLWIAKSLLSKKISTNQIASQLKIQPFQLQKIIKQTNNFSLYQIQILFQKLSRMDFILKSLDQSLIAIHFEMFLMSFKNEKIIDRSDKIP